MHAGPRKNRREITSRSQVLETCDLDLPKLAISRSPSAAAKGKEVAQRIRQRRVEGFEGISLRSVKSSRCGGSEIHKRQQRVHRLIDLRPALRSFITVVVGWSATLRNPLQPR